MGNLTIKSKINRETKVSSEKVNLYIPLEKCCVYEDKIDIDTLKETYYLHAYFPYILSHQLRYSKFMNFRLTKLKEKLFPLD